jgi:hypothetical protein
MANRIAAAATAIAPPQKTIRWSHRRGEIR